MKNKYVLKSSLFLDDEFTDYLNDMSKKGWKLDFMGYYCKFVPCYHHYKYQIDYNEQSDEYLEILKNYGYEEVSCGFDFHIYASQNLQAPDLNTEEQLIIDSKLKKFPKSKVVICFLISIMTFFLAKIFLKEIFLIGIGAYYYHPGYFYWGLLLSVLTVIFSILTFYYILVRRLLKRGIGNLRILKKMTLVKDMIVILFVTVLSVYSLTQVNILDSDFIKSTCLFIAVEYIIAYFVKKTNQKKPVVFFTMMLVFIILPFIFDFENNDEEEIVINHFPISDKIVSRHHSKYTQVVELEHDTHIQDITRQPLYSRECYVECQNKKIAQEVFKYVIVKADKDQREIIDYQKFMKEKEKNTWSSDEISYRSYKQSLSSFEKLKNYYVKDHYVVMLTDNKVIQIYVDNINDIDDILQRFIDFHL